MIGKEEDKNLEKTEEKESNPPEHSLPINSNKPYKDIEKCYSLLNSQHSLNILSQLTIAIDVQLGVMNENDPEDIAQVAKEKPYLKEDYRREVEISFLLLDQAEEEGIKYFSEAKRLKFELSIKNNCSSFLTIFVFILLILFVVFLLTFALPKLSSNNYK